MIESTGTALTGGLIAGTGSFLPRISEKNAPTSDFSAPPRRPSTESRNEPNSGLRLSNDDGDEAVLSERAVAAQGRADNVGIGQNETADTGENGDTREAVQADNEDNQDPGELTEEEQDLVTRLQARDREVRTHEQAHLSAAGDLAIGGPTYDYQRGPDGKRYAVGGEVQIDTSEVPNDPQATLSRAERIKRAALAPAEPSSQDRRVAAKADQIANKARRELAEEALAQDDDGTSGGETAATGASAASPNQATQNNAATTANKTPEVGSNPTQSSDQARGFGLTTTANTDNASGALGNNNFVTYSAQGRGLGARGGLVSVVG